MLTKRRTCPFSKRRPVTPPCFAHRLSSASLTVPPATSTVAAPPVCCRMGVGMWTLMDIASPISSRGMSEVNPASTDPRSRKRRQGSHQRRLQRRFAFARLVNRLELLQRRANHHRAFDQTRDGLLCFQPVAGDANNDFFIARDAEIGRASCRERVERRGGGGGVRR